MKKIGLDTNFDSDFKKVKMMACMTPDEYLRSSGFGGAMAQG